jgi:hypothetical protein
VATGVEPVEKRRARTANVQESGWRRSKSNAWTHGGIISRPCLPIVVKALSTAVVGDRHILPGGLNAVVPRHDVPRRHDETKQDVDVANRNR